MKEFIIMADGTCDLDAATAEKYGIKIIPGHLVFPEQGDIPSFSEWTTVGRDEFYADLKKRPDEYATSPANVEEFAAAMEPYAEQGDEILVMTISSGISGAFNFASRAAEQVLKKYPEAKIEVHGEALPFESRGGYKLDKALRVFPVDPAGKTCLDCGASTGGFTDVLLQHGARKVYAVRSFQASCP